MPDLHLDVCTPEGKTWLAEVFGADRSAPGGIKREFLSPDERNLSRSGKTGSVSYTLKDGVYESNEGRPRFGRRFWIVNGEELVQVSRADALARFAR